MAIIPVMKTNQSAGHGTHCYTATMTSDKGKGRVSPYVVASSDMQGNMSNIIVNYRQ